jgi:2'-5' RNA ligase
MAGFFIEFRMHGYARNYAKELIYSVARKYKVKGVTRKRAVPHISLYGPGNTDDIRKVTSTVARVGRRYTLVPFKLRGFGYFNRSQKVIFLDVNPSKDLEDLRWNLSRELVKVSTCQPWDRNKKHAFHATIAFKDINNKFNQIWHYLKSREEPNINQHLLRITVLDARSRIVCEYDLMLKRLLSRREALSKRLWRKTINRLRELQGLPPEKPLSLTNWLKKILGWS